MTTTNYKGIPVPDAGDSLLSAFRDMASVLGVISPMGSIAAARTALTAAENAGSPPTSEHPAYIDVGGIIYRATGAKGSNQVWDLAPINQTEGYEDTVSASLAGTTITRTAGSQHALITSSLPTRPYNRLVVAWGMCNLDPTGTIGLRMLIRNTDGQTSRYETNGSAESQSVFNMMSVPAGVDPQVILALSFGGSGNSSARLSADRASTRLAVLAFPITMA
ncbi:hypothetical protein [Actinomyces sp. MRS3W]|uniref:hypothetical protein n=1 Tax=Actinomyces sp. MRS3W TaxID=2800796 RepID=UPI0028FDAC1C|nr:hypothetical protein [Actinomyces sp. MRS3W]MDU0347488.1 hypothetical protein [Actinomyces sp. MRS3W]